MRVLFVDCSVMCGQNLGLAQVVTAAKAANKIKVMRPFSYLSVNGYGEYPEKIHYGHGNLISSEYLIKKIEDFQPEVIGFSVTSFTFHRALRIADLLKPAYPQASYIWGGRSSHLAT